MFTILMLLTQVAGSPDPLSGLWASRAVHGPDLRGPIVVQREGTRWRAELGGTRATATGVDTATIRFPGRGELRIRGTGARMVAFWVQPTGAVLPAPYATPVSLRHGPDGRWRGQVEPLDDVFTLFLRVTRTEDGGLTGAFRNPEFNWRGGASSFRISRRGDSLHFEPRTDGGTGLAVGWDSAGRRILMDFGSPVVLRPATPAAAAAFWSRPPGDPRPGYRQPAALGDGWRVARARDAGLSEDTLAALVGSIATLDPTGPDGTAMHAVVVARHGRIVLDEYFHGFGPQALHDLRSASKTLTSVMAGVAVDHGWLAPDTPVDSIFGREAGASQRREITLARLLTHTSGLACDDNDDDSPGNEARLQSQPDETDWYRYLLALPLTRDPGTTYAYCSGGMHLALGMVSRAARTWGPAFFQRYLADPLGIDHYAINLTPTGEAYGGGGMRLRPRDLLKFGQVFLDRGRWNGRRIVSEGWVRASTARQVDTPSGSDGYGWHRFTIRAGGRDYEEFEANGNGGQFLIVLPALDMAVVFTAGNYMQYGVWRKFRETLLPRFLIGAAIRDTPTSP